MAFTEFYCNASTGSNMNGGSDENTSPSYSATNGQWNSGTGVFTPTSGDPSASVTVGEFAHVFADGATTPTFIGRVTAVNSTTVTVSTTAKSGTAPGTAASGVSINVGGVWKGPDGAEDFPFGFITSAQVDASSNLARVNLKNNAQYDVSAGLNHNVAGPLVFQGYTSTPGDGGRAVIDGGSGAAYTLLTVSGTVVTIADIQCQNNGTTGFISRSVLGSGVGVRFLRCVAANVRGQGFAATSDGVMFIDCEAYNINQDSGGANGGFVLSDGCVALRCISHDNSVTSSQGFTIGNQAIAINCIADSNASHGFAITAASVVIGCVSYNNLGNGINISGSFNLLVENCILSSNNLYGIQAFSSANGQGVLMRNCAFYNNTSGETANLNSDLVAGSITLTGDPFTDPADGDFRLNATAGAGDDCRGAGIGTFTQTAASYSGTVGYPDVGAVQHQDAGGGTQLIVGVLGARSIGTY